MKYDVVIIGGGPSGIFSALELSKKDLSILIVEKGRRLGERKCPLLNGGSERCMRCSSCSMVSGWGGAGAYSDGKLTLSKDVGGRLKELVGERLEELIEYVDGIYRDFGAGGKVYGEGGSEFEEMARRAGLRLIPTKIRHIGTERCREIIGRMYDALSGKADIRIGSRVERIETDGEVRGVIVDGEFVGSRFVIAAPGREGSEWLLGEARRIGLTVNYNPIDIGVRVEIRKEVMEKLTDVLYEPKLELISGDRRVRTFCVCPDGEVIAESTGGEDPVITVNGHSYVERKTGNTNFAILVSVLFPELYGDPITYGKSLARMANMMSGGIIVQRLGDLLKGRCSRRADIEEGEISPTLRGAMPGDIGLVMPARFLEGIKEMISALNRVCPGISSPDTLLYGVEVKFYSARIKLTPSLETEVKNLFAIGDGAGITRGLIQASISGVIAAREIIKRL